MRVISLDIVGARTLAERAAAAWEPFVIVSETQTESLWVFSLGHPSGEVVDADLPMLVVEKGSGAIREVYLPSEEGFDIIRRERPVEEVS